MLISKAERFIALRYLRLGRQERFVGLVASFAVLGICLGVATLIVVLSVMDGFRQELLGRVIGVNGHVTVYVPADMPPVPEDVVTSLRQHPDVQYAVTVWEQQALLQRREQTQGILVKGVDFNVLQQKPLVGASLEPPLPQSFAEDAAPLVLGARLAERLGLSAGDTVSLMTLNAAPSAFGSLPRQKQFQIVSLFSSGLYDYDTNVVFMPQASAQQFFRASAPWNSLEISLHDGSKVDGFMRDIETLLPPGVLVRDWRFANRSLFQAIEVERSLMFIILSLIILVAAFNIISTMVILVKNKSRDIAVLRTLGAKPSEIMRIFMMIGMTLGGGGLAAGVLLGVVFARNIEPIRQWIQEITGARLFPDDVYFLRSLPSQVDPVTVAWIAGMTLLLVALATWYPARKASKATPLEILRYG